MRAKFLQSFSKVKLDLGLLALRLFFGTTLLLNYGIPTLAEVLSGNFEYADPLEMGMGLSKILVVFGQFLCAILVIIGWKVRWFCVPLIILFAIAFFVQHSGDPFEYKELSFLYMGAFLVLFLTGGGRYSLGAWLHQNN